MPRLEKVTLFSSVDNRKGFTVVELLIVAAFVSVLAAVAIPFLGGVRQGAGLAKVRADMHGLTRAIERRGSSIRNYIGGSGLKGEMQHEFRVYGRTGQPCGQHPSAAPTRKRI